MRTSAQNSSNFISRHSMEYRLKISRHIRLVICLCISLLLHLAILAGLSSSLDSGHAGYRANSSGDSRRLTVTLSPSRAEEQPVTKIVPGLAANTTGDELPLKDTDESPAAGSHFFNVAELDQHPVITQDIPDNPPELREYPQGGEIVLRLWIDETGKVVNIETVSTTLPQAFADSARASFLRASFSPGRKRGIPVGTVMDVAIRYAPAE